MIIEIPKNASADEIKKILRQSKRKARQRKKGISSFFGKLPRISDGLKYQKNIRNEW